MNEMVYTTPADIRKILAEIVEAKKKLGGIKRAYCVACGGSLSCFYPMTYFLKSEAKELACDSVTANEFVHATPKALGEDCIVFAMSLAGGTPETVEAARVAKEAGASVVVLCSKHDVPLEQYGDYTVIYRIETDNIVENLNQYVILTLAIELLEQTEGYAFYEDALDGLGKIPGICTKALEQIHGRAMAWGERMKDEPVIYTMGSGPSTFVSYMQSICMFMEMEWVHSSSIHTGEYFHGPFEITDKNTPFLVFESEGRTRALDERALRFLGKYAEKVEIIDVKELGINSIADSVVEFFSPILHWVIGLDYAGGLAAAKKHPLMMRRYMYKVEY